MNDKFFAPSTIIKNKKIYTICDCCDRVVANDRGFIWECKGVGVRGMGRIGLCEKCGKKFMEEFFSLTQKYQYPRFAGEHYEFK